MTTPDPREGDVPPVPRYGEYAPGYAPPPSQPTTGRPMPGEPATYTYAPAYAPAGGPAPRRRRTWDVALTVVLLILGLFGVLLGIAYAGIFSSPELLDEVMRQQGFDGFNGSVGAAPLIILVSHIVLYLLAAGIAIPMLVAKRIAFWIPLVAGVVAAIIFWGTLVSVFLSDPGFTDRYL